MRKSIYYLCYIQNRGSRYGYYRGDGELSIRKSPAKYSYRFELEVDSNVYEALKEQGIIEIANLCPNDMPKYYLKENSYKKTIYQLTDKGYKELGLER